ncbi:MAG: hypothetical protein OEY32_00975 [Candidatus Krumholzibacteria bacterium]|nr:hypothetical protein [Candidatus Krumholzibacteria bacterium]
MKLMRNEIFLSFARRCTRGSGRRPRLANAARFAKRNRGALALGVALLVPGAPGASRLEGAWHVGPQPAVRAICHAGDTLWVGTAAGLFVVDIRNGALLERIEAGDRLPSASVRAIAAVGDSVFVATDDGLALYRAGEVRVFTPRAPADIPLVPLVRLYGVSIGRQREVLLSTLGFGAGVIAPGGGYAITRADSLMDDIVFDVKDGPDDGRYFATNAGLCAQFGDTTFAWYQAGAGLPRGETRQLAVAPDGALFVLVSRQGIYRFNGKRAARLRPPDDVPLRDARSISAGPDGALWVAGRGWIRVLRGGQWREAGIAPADAGAAWKTIVADGAGAFAGSDDGLVVALDRGVPLRLDLGVGLPAPRVAAIAANGAGAAWFVSGGRLVQADAVARNVTVDDAPPDARAVTIAPGGDVIAAGRWTVRRREGAGWTDMHPDLAEADPAFTAARTDADGALWVGTRSGAIYRFDGDIWLRVARGSETLDGRGILDVRSAPGGTWAIGAGVPVRCADGGVERFAGIDSSETVVDLERSPAGEWVAVTGGGLFVFDDDATVWRKRGLLEGISGSQPGPATIEGTLTAIAFDAAGTLFLGSTEGLGVVGAGGVRWLRAADTDGGEVADLVAEGGRLWIGFARDGFSVLPIPSLR